MNTSEIFSTEDTRNAILGALSAEEAERLRPHLHPLSLGLGEHLSRPGQVPGQVLFLERGMLSSILRSQQDVSVEISTCGREGIWDALLVLNEAPRTDHVVVQMPGWCWSLPAPILCDEFARGGTLQHKILRYQDLLHTYDAVTGLCNRLHTTEERLARWLLIVREAAEADAFTLPSAFVAAMLGSRPSNVPIALGVLQQAGLICAQGQDMLLLDVPALERTACECHALLVERQRLYLDAPLHMAADPLSYVG